MSDLCSFIGGKIQARKSGTSDEEEIPWNKHSWMEFVIVVANWNRINLIAQSIWAHFFMVDDFWSILKASFKAKPTSTKTSIE